jgi:hypothetical protein
MLNGAVLPVLALSKACTEKDAVDAALGVPEMRPEPLSVRPWGNDPELIDHV